MSLAFVDHPLSRKHETGPGHPERPARYRAVKAALDASFSDVPRHEAPEATRDQLLRAHTEAHVALAEAAAPDRGLVRIEADTTAGPHSLSAARRAAGAGVFAVDHVMAGDARAAFCNVRPPGHHAERERVMGFCLFNNVAVAALHAIHEHGLERVAIVDFDVHHGNGTEDIIRGEERVMLCSSFQHPLYPFSGTNARAPHIHNVPLASGTDGGAWRLAVTPWFDALDHFAPELVLFSAGFDAHARDPLAQLNLLEEDYAWITREVAAIAKSHANGRIVSLLEGGYDVEALKGSTTAHVGALSAS